MGKPAATLCRDEAPLVFTAVPRADAAAVYGE
jgi:hypothetical protein